MSSATASALLLAAGPAHAACVDGPANVRTCTGDLSAGVSAVPASGIDTLLVNGVTTANIAPAVNIDGIDFSEALSLTLTSNTGAFDIVTTGTGIGIDVASSVGSVGADHTGDVTSAAAGIVVSALTTASLTVAGNVSAAGDAIDVFADNGVSVDSTGTLVSTAGLGINADSNLIGAVSVISTGNVTGQQGAIAAETLNGNITVDSTGNLVSSAGAGILASAAGVNAVSVLSEGNITSGAAASAIDVGSAGGAVSVTVNGATSTVVGGSGAGTAAVKFTGGAANTLVNNGILRSLGGWAIRADTGDESVSNLGIVTGNVDLGVGANLFVNGIGAQFRSADTLAVGAGNTFTNLGTFTPGNSGTIQTTGLTGDLTQAAPGSLVVDINTATGASDTITVSGTATMGGTVVPVLGDRSLLDKELLIVDAGAIVNAGLTVADTLAYNYELAFVGTDLFLNIQLISIDALITSPLTPNQASTVAYLDRILDAAPSPAMVLFLDSVGGLATEAEIIAALDRLTPESYAASVGATLQSSLLFANSLMSCPSANETGVVHREGQCYWAQVKARNTEWDATTTNIGGSENATGVTGGMQSFVAPDWLLGGAIAYEHSSADTNNAASSDGDRLSGGFVLKGLYGDTTLATAVFGGVGWYDTERVIALPLPSVTAESDHDVGFAGTALRLSHTFDYGGWYAKPMIDAGATYLSYGDIRETGAGVANLIVEGESQWLLNVGAALELGRTFAIQPGLFARPYIRVGVTALSDSDFSLTSRFEGAPGGVAPFTVTSSYDDVVADLAAGMDVFATSGLSVNIAYDGKFGDTSESHAGSAKLRMAF